MDIIVVHPADPICPGMGGAVRWANNLSSSLSKLGHSITLIGWNSNGIHSDKYNELGYKFIPCMQGRYDLRRYFVNLFIKLPFLKCSQDAVIITHRFDIMSICVLFKPRNPKIMVSTCPLYAAERLWPNWFPIIKILYELMELLVLPRLDIIGVMDETTKRRYERMKFIREDLCQWTWTSVDLEKFKPLLLKKDPTLSYSKLPRKITLAYAGRIDKVKNLDFLLRSYRLVENKDACTELVLYGTGPELGNMINLAQTLGIRNIRFSGAIPANDMPDVLNSVDIIVLPTVGCEGSPTIIKEALACDVPIVSMDVGDVKRILSNPLAGRIVMQEDEEAMADAILEVMKLIRKGYVKEACRSLTLEYSIQRFGHHWECLIKTAIESRQKHRGELLI